MSGVTGERLPNGRSGLRQVRRLASLRRRIPFSDVGKTAGPPAKTAGILRDPRLLRATFGDWRCNGQKTKKPSNTAKTLGLQGVKVVSAEGIEPSTY
jgi:hypothetical protein